MKNLKKHGSPGSGPGLMLPNNKFKLLCKKENQETTVLKFQHLHLDRLEENIGSVNIEFAADELRDINNGSSEIKVEGTRYPEQLKKVVAR